LLSQFHVKLLWHKKNYFWWLIKPMLINLMWKVNNLRFVVYDCWYNVWMHRFPMASEHFLDWFSSSFMPFTTEQQGGTMMLHLVVSTMYDYSLDWQKERTSSKEKVVLLVHTKVSWNFFFFSFFLKGITCFHTVKS